MSKNHLLYTTITPILGGLIIVLNTLQYYCIRRIQRMESGRAGGGGLASHHNLAYIKSLCASDILAGVTMVVLKSMNPFMATTLKDDDIAKETYSILRLVVLRFSLFSSIFNLIAMTVDRYFSIFHPVKHRNQSRHFTHLVIGAVWVLSFFLVFLVYCITRWVVAKDSTSMVNLIFPVSTFPATLVFVYCYTTIYTWIRQRCRKDIKNKVRFLKLAFVVVLTFVLCWLPLSTCQLVKATGIECGGSDFQRTYFTLAFANSLFNPIIYFLHARKKLKKCLGLHRRSSIIRNSHCLSSSQCRQPVTSLTSNCVLSALDTKM